MEERNKIEIPLTIKESDIVGEKIIFDLVIKDKLSHVIVNQEGQHFHINLDGEDLGYFTNDGNGHISRFEQPKGAERGLADYFTPIEAKLREMNKLSN
jgi:hypothetical protein